MSGLDIFALIVLVVLVLAVLAIWAMLGMYPGKIARERKHPQAEAISVCGWWGAITMGILSPLAFVWAYTNPNAALLGENMPPADQAAAEPQEGDES